MQYHTFQLKQERAFPVLMRKMIAYLKKEIKRLDYKVRNVTNLMSKKDKVPFSLFYVDHEPSRRNIGRLPSSHLLKEINWYNITIVNYLDTPNL